MDKIEKCAVLVGKNDCVCVSETNSNLMGDDHIIKKALSRHNSTCVEKCECEYGKASNDSHVLKFVKNCMDGLSQTGKCVCGQGCPYPTMEDSQ